MRSQRGQAVAEFVVVAPILLLLLFGTIGFGHVLYTRMIVMQAANRAARLGAVLYGDSTVPKATAAQRTRDAAMALLNASLPKGDRRVTIRTTTEDIYVTVTYRAGVLVPFLRPWLGDTYASDHEAVYRIEKDSP